MCVVLLEYLAALGLIWEVVQALLSSVPNAEEKFTLSLIFVALAAAIIMAAIQVPRGSGHRVAGTFGAAATVIALICFLVAAWWPSFSQGGDKWWGTAGTVVLFGGLTTTCLFQFSRDTPRRWRYAGIIAAALASLMLLHHLWIGPRHDPVGNVAFYGLLILSCVVAHANGCLVLKLRPSHQWVRTGAIVFATSTAAMILMLVIGEEFRASRIGVERAIFGRLAAAGGIVTGCGTLALLVLARMNRKVDAVAQSDEVDSVDLFCPRCRKKQSAPLGDSACPSCGLRIFIRVEEPRCTSCDYLLRGLVSDRCPECGTLIASRA